MIPSNKLHSFNRDLRVIFTISPVRHWKDGAHGNQVSKSILFLAVEKLLKHSVAEGYFPAYELVMDDLRDYRYYAEDMLHPSQTAVDYIWKAFQIVTLSLKPVFVERGTGNHKSPKSQVSYQILLQAKRNLPKQYSETNICN